MVTGATGFGVRPAPFDEIGGEAVLVVDRLHGDTWRPAYLVRIHARGGVIDRISDYYACRGSWTWWSAMPEEAPFFLLPQQGEKEETLTSHHEK
ncbi:hypothetical protein ACVDG5_014130 [Mesorhizobium sp. ORM6]